MAICDGATGAKVKVEYSDNPNLVWNDVGHTWNDIRAVTGMIDVRGGDKAAEEYRTFAGSVAGMTEAGLINLILSVVFQNSTTSFLEFLLDSWDGTGAEVCLYIRWSYNEGASGALRRTAKVALLTNPHTGGDASSARPIVKELTFVVDGAINRDTVP